MFVVFCYMKQAQHQHVLTLKVPSLSLHLPPTQRGKASCSARAKFSHQLDCKYNFSVKTASVVLGWCGVQLPCPWSLSAAGRQSSMAHPTCSGISHPHPLEHLSSVNLSSDSQEHTEARSFDEVLWTLAPETFLKAAESKFHAKKAPLKTSQSGLEYTYFMQIQKIRH